MNISLEFQYFILFSFLLIIPKMLLRYRIPAALTALGFGFFTTIALGWFNDDEMILMMARLGITSLFLFAGMEVDIDELKEDSNVLIKHLTKVTLLIVAVGFGLEYFFDIGYRASMILSLGIMTPSTGFILDSLKGIHLTEGQEKWVRSKAISKELVAIFMLFVILQTQSISEFVISTAIITAMIFILPPVFRFFLEKIAPFAPDSEASFLILIALLCGVITTKIGAYYLVGAFIVGMTAGRFRHFMENENSGGILSSVSFFFSFFAPFYFYKAGLSLKPEMFSLTGVMLGLILTAVFLPLRYTSTISSIWFFNKESWSCRNHIALPLIPNLIFGLVIMSVLRDRFNAPDHILSGLIIYTLAASVIPWFLLKPLPPEEHDSSMVR